MVRNIYRIEVSELRSKNDKGRPEYGREAYSCAKAKNTGCLTVVKGQWATPVVLNYTGKRDAKHEC